MRPSLFPPVKAAMLGLLLAAPSISSAAWLEGNTVRVWYDDTLSGPFGTPTLVGDSVAFHANTLAVSSASGSPVDYLRAGLNLRFEARQGYALQGFDALAGGSYLVSGAGALAAVFGGLGGYSVANQVATQWTPVILSAGQGGSSQLWDSRSSLAFSGSAFNLDFRSLLVASSFDGSSYASVGLDDVVISAETIPVPEPGQWALMLGGLGVMGGMVRRRLQQPR